MFCLATQCFGKLDLVANVSNMGDFVERKLFLVSRGKSEDLEL